GDQCTRRAADPVLRSEGLRGGQWATGESMPGSLRQLLRLALELDGSGHVPHRAEHVREILESRAHLLLVARVREHERNRLFVELERFLQMAALLLDGGPESQGETRRRTEWFPFDLIEELLG